MPQGSQGGAVECAPHFLVSVADRTTLTHLQLTLVCFYLLFTTVHHFIFFTNKIIIIKIEINNFKIKNSLLLWYTSISILQIGT